MRESGSVSLRIYGDLWGLNYRTAPSTPRGWRGPKRTKGSRDLTSSHSRMPGMVTGLVDPAPSLLDCRFVATSAAPGGFAALLGGVVDTASHHTAPRHICLSICTAWRGAAEGSTDAAPNAADTEAAPAPTAAAGQCGAADAGSTISTAGRRGTTEVSITATGLGDTEEGADLGSTAAEAVTGGTAVSVVVAGTTAGTATEAGRSATCAVRNARRTAASEDRMGQPSHSWLCRSPTHSCLGKA